MPELTHKQFAELSELLRDAESCARLSQWEEEFLSDLRSRALIYKDDLRISDKQWGALRRIEEKVYA
jgi:hypothetical protein